MKPFLLLSALLLLTGCHEPQPVVISVTHKIQLEDDSRILLRGDHVRALIMDRGDEILLDCQWYPTAIHYAEDVRCQYVDPLPPAAHGY